MKYKRFRKQTIYRISFLIGLDLFFIKKLKNMKRNAVLLLMMWLASVTMYAQVAINTDGSSATGGSVMLDVKSDTAGILIPRMSATDRDDIDNPVEGLMVYVNDQDAFYFYDGSAWKRVGEGVSPWNYSQTQDTIYRFDGSDTLVAIASDEPTLKVYGRISQTGTGKSVYVGEGAGSSVTSGGLNAGIGYNALKANTSGNENTATGSEALSANTTGKYNTASGYQALYSNQVGWRNTAVGYQALYSNGNAGTAYKGYDNTAVGFKSLYSNVDGNYNTAIGYYALNQNTGKSNVASGYYALNNNTSGEYNVGVGVHVLDDNTSGGNNTAVGHNALSSNTTGSNNTALGENAFSSGTAYSNSTALGNGTAITASNQVRIGNSSVTSIGGYADWTNISDKRAKKNIKENVAGLDFILKLRPVTYHLDMDAVARLNHTPDEYRDKTAEQAKAAELQVGFIAQEVERVANDIDFDFHGVDKPKNENDFYGLRYAELWCHW